MVGSSSAPQTVSINLQTAGTVESIKVFTQGIEDADFHKLGDNCRAKTFSSGQTCTVDVAFSPNTPGDRRGTLQLFDRANHVLGVQHLFAIASGPLATFVPGIVTSVAGNSSSFIYSGDGILATNAALFLPFGVTVDANGNLYIADTFNNRIRRVDAQTLLISTVAGNGKLGNAGDGGLATAASLNNPSSLELDAAGNLYIADTNNNVVRVVDSSTGIISTVAGNGSAAYAGDGGQATASSLKTPNGLTFDPAGNLYIADTGNNAVRRVNITTGIITTVAGNGTAAYSGDGGVAETATLNSPWGVTYTNSGVLYIADQKNHAIRKVDATGIITTIAGNGNPGFSGDGGPALASRLSSPSSVIVDPAGNIYISDTGNNRIQKINPVTNIIKTVAGSGANGDRNPATQVALYGPYTIALDAEGSLLIADAAHNRIRKISSNVAILIYPLMRVGSVSAPMSQVLENDGTATLNLSGIDPITNAQIDPTTTCTPNGTLAPLAQCTVAADFAPTTTGLPVNGSITVNSDALNASGSILLQGNVQSTFPTNVLLSSTPNPSIVGNNVVFSVQVINSGGVIATGKVTILDGTTNLGTLTLANGIASLSISNLSIGQHTITASYGGDVNGSAATSLGLLQIVTAVPINSNTSTSLSSNPNPVVIGQVLNLNATVSAAASGQAIPTGSVVFMEGTSTLGTGTLSGGVASISTSSLAVGTHLITAIYGGSSSYGSSMSPVLTQVVIASGSTSDTPKFTLVSTPSMLSLQSGARGTLQITLTAGANFADTLSLGCGGLPAMATCTFSQDQFAVTAGAVKTLSVVVDTGNPLGAGPVAKAKEMKTSQRVAVLAGIFPLGLLFSAMLGRSRRRRLEVLLFVIALSSLAAISGCGSSYRVNSTAVGTYTFQVFATGTTTGSSYSAPVQLVVTK